MGQRVKTGYFILTFKDVKIKIVNIGSTELRILTTIIKRNCKVCKEGWDRSMTYSLKLEEKNTEQTERGEEKPVNKRSCSETN